MQRVFILLISLCVATSPFSLAKGPNSNLGEIKGDEKKSPAKQKTSDVRRHKKIPLQLSKIKRSPNTPLPSPIARICSQIGRICKNGQNASYKDDIGCELVCPEDGVK